MKDSFKLFGIGLLLNVGSCWAGAYGEAHLQDSYYLQPMFYTAAVVFLIGFVLIAIASYEIKERISK